MNRSISSSRLFQDYIRKLGDKTELFEALRSNYNIESALYPGSSIDINIMVFVSIYCHS